jgi:hypothetical protein
MNEKVINNYYSCEISCTASIEGTSHGGHGIECCQTNLCNKIGDITLLSFYNMTLPRSKEDMALSNSQNLFSNVSKTFSILVIFNTLFNFY